MDERLPWHTQQWHTLNAARASGRMPHALLLRGPTGVGKHRFAERLAAWLLCEQDTLEGRPCATCRGCRLIAAGTHPDLARIAPLEGKTAIGIEQIRDLIEYIGLTRQYASHKVVLLAPAEAMTRGAANSLLKTLEEPPGSAVFVLVSHRSALLPATIRSRCQVIDFPMPPGDGAREWLAARLGGDGDPETLLALGHGAPLTALDLARRGTGQEDRTALLEDLVALAGGGADPVAAAARWRRWGLRPVVHWLCGHTADLIRLKCVPGRPKVTSTDLREPMQGLAEKLNLLFLFEFFDECLEARRALDLRQNLNEQLVLESLAVGWRRLGSDSGA
ncbi:MAG: DNA polymerase III subunit delta' [Gammaproteobacteria bacterium]|nr:DNA polymerase III subunit delta' [Gammaproteobacteria bacterium]NIR85716.1 DNA polymerase III subunit delta' [Gammaproteobacteria bacterium]NIR90249.1 DNA polymerase III subunit delta' [Gammaproteobacteria bacterium]NIU06850.1 DNA polymerase III subunit delta' [Gammaproteobacteria bacterium]NIV53783.1 DNA polymerase III subunit delta' [Gammaproteobacteria bacterium]